MFGLGCFGLGCLGWGVWVEMFVLGCLGWFVWVGIVVYVCGVCVCVCLYCILLGGGMDESPQNDYEINI